MKIKTKSGFVCDVNENKAKDWRFTKALAKWENEETTLVGMTFCIPFLLGEDGEEKLMNHVKESDGSIPSSKVISEFREILDLMGKELKKSQSLQG